MRLDKLHLWRYGKFTDFTLDFGKYQKNKPDLHLVYGPNEAGKTTLMSAYLDFLFGFPSKSTPYNFKHANNTLKVGGHITADKKALEFHRVKKMKNSLTDANEQPTDDGVLLQQLAGLSKQSYESMFSLDDHSLEEGGESILASEGDLGKLLYSATTGVAQLSNALIQMREKSDLFYKKGKRNFELAVLKNRLKNINSNLKEIDVNASVYSKLVKQRDEAVTHYHSLGDKHDDLKLQIQKLQQKKNAYPRLASLRRLQAALQPFNDLPDTPTSWPDEVKQLHVDSIKLDTIESDLLNNIKTVSDAINTIKPDDAALSAHHQWTQIEHERDAYLIATTSLQNVEHQLQTCLSEIAGHLHKLGQSDVKNGQSLILDAATLTNIKELIHQHTALQSRLASAEQELALAEKQHKAIQLKLSHRGGIVDASSHNGAVNSNATAIEDLELCIAPFANNELVTNFHAVLQQKNAAQQELDALVASLSPWQGDVKTLPSLRVPCSADLQSLQSERDALFQRISTETITRQTLTQNLSDLQSQKKSYSATGLVDDSELLRLRTQRDAAWKKHRKTLDADTADAFEQAMRLDDSSQATRLQHTESLVKLSQLSRDIVVNQDSVDRSNSALEQLRTEEEQFDSKLKALINSISPTLDLSMSVEALTNWIDTLADAVRVLNRLAGFELHLDTVSAQASTACDDITTNLIRVGGVDVPTGQQASPIDKLSTLLKSANSTLKQHRALAGLQEQLVASQHQLDTRALELEDSKNSLNKWTQAWQKVCESCWLGSKQAVPTPSVVNEYLHQLTPLEKQLAQQSSLIQKKSQIKNIIQAYDKLLITLSEQLSMATANVSTGQIYQNLLERMESATAEQKALQVKREQRNSLLEQQKLNQIKRATIQTSIDAKSTFFGVDSIDDILLKLQDVTKKQDLQKRLDNEQNELLALLEVDSLSDATSMFTDFDADLNQLEMDKLERTASDLDLSLREAHTAQQDAQKAVETVGGDDEVALLNEQRANLLLEIEDKISGFLQQHLALNAADAALKVFRDNHRSSMMSRASEAFSTISQGRYIRLETFQNGTSEQLIAIEKDGGSKISSALSKGTRFQLYLALRVAGYHEYSLTRPAVPFLADDILETSDDQRAAQTFSVLGDMAEVGQVIYFTHHQHLCDIAKQAVPSCTIHQLP